MTRESISFVEKEAFIMKEKIIKDLYSQIESIKD